MVQWRFEIMGHGHAEKQQFAYPYVHWRSTLRLNQLVTVVVVTGAPYVVAGAAYVE